MVFSFSRFFLDGLLVNANLCFRGSGQSTASRDRGGRGGCRCRERVVGADGRVGGEERERHQGTGGGDAGGDVVGGVEAVEEGGAGGVVDGGRERWMAALGQLVGGGERGTDGSMRVRGGCRR